MGCRWGSIGDCWVVRRSLFGVEVVWLGELGVFLVVKGE